MRLAEARAIANAAIEEHLHGKGWTFTFDNAKRRFGCCHYQTKTITLSKHLVQLNDVAHVRNTILHEVAHAMVPRGTSHGAAWRRQAIAIGCTGNTYYDSMAVAKPKAKYIGKCPNCPFTIRRHRRSQGSCPRCSGGRYNPLYKLRWA